jgi:hypothetical protein
MYNTLCFMANGQEAVLPRRKSADARVHTGIRLDAATLERLGKGERGVSEEIRARLERTFKEDDLDPVMRELCDGLVKIAAKLRDDYRGEDWHTWPRAHEAFAAAAAQLVADYAPTPRVGPTPTALDDLYLGPDHPPDVIGKLRARDVEREHTLPYVTAALARWVRGQRALLAQGIKVKKGDKQ